ncbi:DUF1707 SHOCT-like domain-containing protein [Streptomyces iconiensis]|uniref:DUF1707 domain-containing protein n=1 Tax=Streptomyces iconiensis TaxID=1384038 RepID=A0ABT6ZPR3_9ACTN|nr:DUF1707 domain-containing protein [Streptomyces iconiensis]MDJ1131046.1 DUF1707 domain-containing protein [Streptomyces iconiensis]
MTEELPEIRASDAEREQTAEVLRDALAEGRLGMDEFQERLDGAYEARTHGQLVKLVRDLPSPQGEEGRDTSLVLPGSAPAAPAGKRRWTERIGGTGTSRWGIGLLGGFSRKGGWTVPRNFTSVTVMGGGQIDLRNARFEDRVVVIRCFALWGGVQVVVPEGIEVEVRGVGIMGGFDSSANSHGEPGAPRVIVTGLAVMGGVATEQKPAPGERGRDREQDRDRGRDLGWERDRGVEREADRKSLE